MMAKESTAKTDSKKTALPEEDAAAVAGTAGAWAVMRYEGKQYVAREGNIVDLPSPRNFESDAIEVGDILMAGGKKTIFGTPLIAGATVRLRPVSPVTSERGINFKRRRRKNTSKRTKGFRINSIRCEVEAIHIPGKGRKKAAATA